MYGFPAPRQGGLALSWRDGMVKEGAALSADLIIRGARFGCGPGAAPVPSSIVIGAEGPGTLSPAAWGNVPTSVFIGNRAGRSAAVGAAQLVIVGAFAASQLTTGTYSVAIGSSAASNLGAATRVTAVGDSALATASPPGDRNTVVGYFAGRTATGGSNACLGDGAGENIGSGYNNVCLGASSGATSGGLQDTIAVGYAVQPTVSNQAVIGRSDRTFWTKLFGLIDTTGDAHDFAIESVSANTTLGITHHTLLVDATSGNKTITLPVASATNVNGRYYVVIKSDSSANTVTVTRAGSDTIEGATTVVLTAQYQKTKLQAYGAGSIWYIL